MSFNISGIAEATAGHDKGELYAVLNRNESTAFLVNGRERKLSRPKKKNNKHVIFLPDSVFKTVSGKIGEGTTDAALRRELARIRTELRDVHSEQGGT